MSKPINENLRDVRVENESGDLIPLLDHADDPRQTKLELKPVASEPARELKTVTA